MHRVNFAGESGVITDVCRNHGVWFEREELRKIVEFIRGGGMRVARERQLGLLERERQRIADEFRAAANINTSTRADAAVWGAGDDRDALDAIRVTFEIAKWLKRG
jgi:Zn-finger nucleic acid-binding protein